MAQRQINVRLDDEEFEKFWTAAFVEGRSLPEELRSAVRAHLGTFEGNPHFEAALAARMGRAKEQENDPPTVSSLDQRRKRARRQDA